MMALRRKVFERFNYRCAKCASTVTWESGELHERKTRGLGGLRSIENCEPLCRNCHTGTRGEHGFARGKK